MPPPRLSVVVFAKDEEPSIREVLSAVKGKADELIVMDGRSKDGTHAAAEAEGALVLTDSGEGKGAAQIQALAAVTGDVVVFMDADLSDDVSQFEALVAPVLDGRAHLVIGSRFAGGSEEISINFLQMFRVIGNVFINAVINWRWEVYLTDTLNCYRAMDVGVARRLGLSEKSAAIEHEMVMKALKGGFNVINVPTHEFARKHGESKINPWKIGHRFFICLFKNLI
jgi:glycosyltransferase involved in cell wall biosynthesis